MKSLQGAASELSDLGVRVLGLSRDSVQDQARFAEECELEMALLSDPDGSVTAKYDVDMEGRPFAQRVTFVVDAAGKVRLRDEKVSVRSHGSDLVERIRELQGD